MATKDITDRQVCEAYRDFKVTTYLPDRLLAARTGEPHKVCLAAMERAAGRGLIDYGVTLRSGWLTDKGKALLAGSAA